jgi:MFS family permease
LGPCPRHPWSELRPLLSLERNVFVISATGLLVNLGAQAFQPFIPLYLQALNATVSQIGIIYVLIAVASNLSFFGGLLADRLGRKSIIVLGGAIGFGLFLALLRANNWVLVSFILFLSYLFATFVQPALTSTIAESVEVRKRGNAFSSYWVLAYLGLAAGSLIGGYLPNPGRFELNIILIGMAGIGAALIRFVFLKETLSKNVRVSPQGRNRFFPTHFSRNVWLLMAMLLFFNFSSGLGLAIYPLFSTMYLQLSQEEFAVMIGAASLAAMLGALGAGRLSTKIGVKRMMILAVLLSGILLIPWVYASTPLLAIGAYALSGFFAQFFLIGNQTLMANVTVAKERGSIIGFVTTVAGLSSIVAPYLGSQLWVLADPKVPFLISIILSGLVVIPLMMVNEPSVEGLGPAVSST